MKTNNANTPSTETTTKARLRSRGPLYAIIATAAVTLAVPLVASTQAAPAPDATKAVATEAATKGMQSLGLEKDADPSLPTGWIIAISVAVGGAMLALQLRKRDGAATSRDTIRVVSTRQVGPKARVVLIETRGREILLSVGDRGASLISDWWVEGQAEKEKVEEKEPAASLDDKWFEPAEEASDAAEPTPAPAPIRREERRAPATPAPAPAVSAVSGLVRLRTKSTTRGSKQTSESQLLADDLLDAGPRPGRLDVTATQLYGQWSKQLLGR